MYMYRVRMPISHHCRVSWLGGEGRLGSLIIDEQPHVELVSCPDRGEERRAGHETNVEQ